VVSIEINKDISLRTLADADAHALFETIDASRPKLRNWLPWVDGTTTREHSLQFIRNAEQEINQQEGLVVGIFHHGKIIGTIGMHEWNHQVNLAQVGYWLNPDYERKGIATMAVSAFVNYLFTRVGLNKLEIRFVADNSRSAKLADRLGFKVEGVIRESCVMNGLVKDMVVTGLLKKEWN
jgi:ribosomal-protein-serine acetyltransferase